jgi:hypothetical protein
MHQRNSFKEIGITKKHLLTYIVLAVPISFMLGLGEYMVIKPGYLIPDLTFGNLLNRLSQNYSGLHIWVKIS